MVFKMEAALLQQPQWNMNAMMADNEEVDSDEAVSDDEGIEGFNVSPLFFFFIFSSTIVNIPHGIIILAFAGLQLLCSSSLYPLSTFSFVSLLGTTS